ncbi:MAG: N-carbamyl-L-amino acid amidohydrolase [Chloroflexota bacterium]
MIDFARIHADIATLATYVEPETLGTTRRAFTPAYAAGRAWLRAQFDEAGLVTTIDAGGNLVGRREGSAVLPPIMIGSHSDTVMGGGRYDGALGVLAGLAIARTLRDTGVTLAHPLEVVDFLAEESTPLGSLIGSTALSTGIDDRTLLLNIPGWGTLADALVTVGGDPHLVRLPLRQSGDIAAYLEVHIEQGPFLEHANHAIAAVTGIVGIRRADIICRGRPDHAGTAHMQMRHDALAAVATVIAAAESAAHALPGTVATVGALSIGPNQSNVVPGLVRFSVEMRSLQWQEVESLWQTIHQSLVQACDQRGVSYEIEMIHDSAPVTFPTAMVEVVRNACAIASNSTMQLASGAGHDAGMLAGITPAAMIFVRTKDGRSHCPEEYAAADDINAAVVALYHAVRTIDARHQEYSA